jgi:hypothetical protein
VFICKRLLGESALPLYAVALAKVQGTYPPRAQSFSQKVPISSFTTCVYGRSPRSVNNGAAVKLDAPLIRAICAIFFYSPIDRLSIRRACAP